MALTFCVYKKGHLDGKDLLKYSSNGINEVGRDPLVFFIAVLVS